MATTTSNSVNALSFAELSKVAANENRKQLDVGAKAYGVGPSVGVIKQRNKEVRICRNLTRVWLIKNKLIIQKTYF